MTLKEQMAADNAVFFNTDEFADETTYTPASGDALVIDYIDDSQSPGIMPDIVPADEKTILVPSAGLSPQKGDQFLIDGESWHLSQVIEKEAGIFRLRLSRAEWRSPKNGWRM